MSLTFLIIQQNFLAPSIGTPTSH